MGQRNRKTEARNRLIFSAFERGSSLAQLSRRFGLTESTVAQIIRQEGHRRALSPDAYYRALRSGEDR